MAEVKHISTSLRFTLEFEGEGGKSVNKTLSVSRIGAGAAADDLNALAGSVGGLLEYPVKSVKKYDTGLIENE
ncbi:MAG: hypothetical protein IKT09_01355 [Synergistes sp.]|nr:hypothetical protein [Synergistes sp.]